MIIEVGKSYYMPKEQWIVTVIEIMKADVWEEEVLKCDIIHQGGLDIVTPDYVEEWDGLYILEKNILHGALELCEH